jgi:predicted dehydrogenase
MKKGRILNVGIAGYGRSGHGIHAHWLRQAQDKFRIVAVSDALPERRKDAADEWKCPVFADYREMLETTKMDLFINALPSFLHPDGTVLGFESGNHVVCEKPLGRTVKQFDRMWTAAKKAKKTFLPFQNSRFYPFFGKMREIIDSGVLGEILHIRSVWSGFGRRWDWQTLQESDGGNLLNTGPHPMDHAIMLFGQKTPKVFCQMRSIQPFGGDAEDFCAVTLYGPGSPMIEILVSSYVSYPLGEQYNVFGTLGGLSGNPQQLKWKYFDPAKAPKQTLWQPWSLNRGFCTEKLPWEEYTWTLQKDLDDFQYNSRAFYNNVHDVLVNGVEQVVRPEEVRRQIAVMEECHRQNPLPKRKKK